MATDVLSRKIRKEIPAAYLKRLPREAVISLPWDVLEKLCLGLDALPEHLRGKLLTVIRKKDVTGYFELQKMSNPLLYDSADSFFAVTSVMSFLKKYPFGKVATLDPLNEAVKRFYLAERLCRITNRRLAYFRVRPYRLKNRWAKLHGILHTARLYIREVLGPLDLNQIYDHMRHGPGGALGVTGIRTTAYYKYAASSYTTTTGALPYAETAILADPLWRRYVVTGGNIGDDVPAIDDSSRKAIISRLKVTDYNKVTFVEKTAQTHRAIAIEPLFNIYLQLGVGDFLTKRLRDWGTNLSSQERNRSLAWLGSRDWLANTDGPVTLDLSMASDTMSRELVRELLPEEWYDFLDSIRSKYGLIEGSKTLWAKFSSMGNGFTFQLESMIFAALIHGVAKCYGYTTKNLSVYGDDIIVPKGLALAVVDVLAYCGFHVNSDKSYFFGAFRESCGADYFEGSPVRPFYLKRQIQNAKDLVFVSNSFKSNKTFAAFTGDYGRIAGRHDLSSIISATLFRYLPDVVARNLLGPITEDLEGHIFTPWDLAQKSRLVLWDKDVQAWSYASMKASPKTYSGDAVPIYLQLMGAHGLGRGASQSDCRRMESRKDDPNNGNLLIAFLLALEERKTANSSFASAVTRRDSTRLRLATQTHTGWRND